MTVRATAAIGYRIVLWALALLACAPSQLLAESSMEKAIRARQSAYFLMGQQMGYINATIKGDLAFDKTALLVRAQALDALAHLVSESYPAGSDQGSTKAKPDIWKDSQRFKQLVQESQSETSRLKAAVEAGDLGAIQAAYRATGKSCKTCHDLFKAK